MLDATTLLTDYSLPMAGGQLSLFGGPPPAAAPASFQGPDKLGRASIAYAESKSVLTPASGFMDQYKFTLNPYAGCSFGCEYCYARFFARTDEMKRTWGDWVTVKTNAVEQIDKACRSSGTKSGLQSGDAVYMSSVTDPYQPIEQKLGLTRAILERLLELNVQPRLTVQTRSPIATRDIDLFKRFDRIRVNFTVTTDSEEMRLRYEPHCPAIEVRLKAAEEVSAADVPIGISISPMLPLKDVEGFARRMAALGAAEYVTQYFKPIRARFTAGTTVEAMGKMAEDQWSQIEYEAARRVIQEHLGSDQPLLEGSAGYAPA